MKFLLRVLRRRRRWLSASAGAGLALFSPALPSHAAAPFTDSDGDTYTVTLSGGGAAQVTLDDPDLDQKGPIASITLTGAKAASALKVAVKKGETGDGKVSIGAITADGSFGSVNAVKSDLVGAGVTAAGVVKSLKFGNLADGASITLGTAAKVTPLALTAANVGDVTLSAPGSTLTLSALSVGPGASIQAAQAATLKTTAGAFAGEVRIAGKMVGLLVAGGNFTGRVHAASINSISVKKNKAGAGGSIVDSTIAATGAIGAVLLDGDLTNSQILAGANLGADGAVGGSGADADTFAAGALRTVSIKGNVSGAVIGAGFTPVDGTFGDLNDGAIGGKLSKLTTFTVKGTMDAASLIGAGLLPKTVTINKLKVKPIADARFISRGVIVPRNPVMIAKPLDPTKQLPAAVATDFLFTGKDPVQTGVAPGTIEPARAAVVRGRVLSREDVPLAGVRVTVLEHEEFGQTFTRADGMFDLAVNGGGQLVVAFAANGFAPAQRQVDPATQDFAVLGDVVLVSADPAMTEVTLGAGAPMQMHAATVQSDASGDRRAALMFQPETSAALVMPDGTTTPMNSLRIRATEFTVGPNGPAAMPGALPPNSAYTYCVDLTADEAGNAGATTVTFTKPVYLYVENFLNFEIGITVPSGFYDRQKGVWEAGPSGRIIQILSETAGAADLDVTGDGVADTGAALATLNISDEERTQLATDYAAGQSLWRVPIPHFSPWDANWAFGPPPGAGPPNPPPPTGDDPPNDPDDPPSVYIQSQSVGERVELAGVPFGLRYRSERVPGRVAATQLRVPLDGGALPGPVKRIEVEVTVAGRSFVQQFPATTGQTATFAWNGLDAYDRAVIGRQAASVRVGYVYDGDYTRTNRFGLSGTGVAITGDRTRQEITLSTTRATSVGAADVRRPSLGGWTFEVHHSYDPVSRKLQLGSGSSRQAESIAGTIRTAAGNGQAFTMGTINDGVPAANARLLQPTFLASAADGTVYFTDNGLHQIFRVDPAGVLRVVAGVAGSPGSSGDEIPAATAQVSFPFGIAVAPDGTIFFNDGGTARTRSITPDGLLHTVAGTGVSGYAGDGGPATAAQLRTSISLTRAADGTLFISDANNHVIRRVGTDGIITTAAGTGTAGFAGDNGPATAAQLNAPFGIVLDREGNLYIGDSNNRRIRKVGPNGIITTIAGNGTVPFDRTDPAGDGGPATLARLGVLGLRLDRQGDLIFADDHLHRIRKITRDGLITSLAGSGNTPSTSTAPNGNGGAALQALIGGPGGDPADVEIAPDDSLYVADASNRVIRRVAPPLPGFTGSEFVIPSDDGGELYRFDAGGRHLSTVNSLTGDVLYSFAYDSDGQLVKVTDGVGNDTTIQRTAGGAPTAIVGPFGHRTLLTTDASGNLTRIQDPDGGAHVFTVDAGGLLTAETEPAGQFHTFGYDGVGLLTQADHAGPAVTGLSRVQIPDGYFVTTTSALGDAVKYQLEKLSNGDELRTNSDAAGVLTTDRRRAAGVQTFTSRDGTSATVTLGADARFGLQAARGAKVVATTPGGHTYTVENSETVALTNPGEPLSLTTASHTTKINGNSFSRTYDAATRTFTDTTTLGRQLRLVTDAQGRLVEWIPADASTVRIAYSGAGQISSLTAGTGAEARSSRFTFKSGYPASFINALNQEEKFVRNAFGQTTRHTRSDGSVTLFTYDASRRIASVTPPGRPAHTFTHTPSGEVATYTAPDAGSGSAVTTLSYDADQRLTQIAEPGGATVDFGYDATGRLASRTADGGTTTFAYNAAGLPTTISAPGGNTTTFSYDGAFFLGTSYTGEVVGSASRTIDNFLRLASYSINGANPVNLTYDGDGDLIAAGDLVITRDATRGWTSGTTLGVVTDARTFNSFGELTGYAASANGSPLFSVQSTYDKLSRVVRSVETVGAAAAETFDYAYDALGRLREVKKNGVVADSFTYDANGNRLTRGAVTAAADAQDRLTQFGAATFTYSPSGRRLTRVDAAGTTTYSHDARGGLIGVAAPAASPITYLIDPYQRRIGKKVGGVLTKGFLYDSGQHLMAELDGANAVVNTFVYGERSLVPSYLIRGGEKFRLITDLRGSVRLVVNATTGAVVQRLDYSVLGEVLTDTNPGFQPLGFAGGLYDPETGLTRIGVRDYDAATGVWLQKDPLLFRGRQLNLYAYAGGDPVSRVDVAGLHSISIGLDQGTIGHASISIDGGQFQGFATPGEGFQMFGDNPGQIGPAGQPNTTVTIDGLTTEQIIRIKEFLKREKRRGKKRKYNLVFSNCTDFVIEALEAGDVLRPTPLESLIPNYHTPHNSWDSPASFLAELEGRGYRIDPK